MAMRGEPVAVQPAVLGLPEGEREGRTGRRARPSAGAAGCPRSHEAVGPLCKGWRAAVHGPVCRDTLCPMPAWGGPSCSTPGKSLAAVPCPKENFSLLQDVAQPRCAFPIVDVSRGAGGPGWKRGYGGSQLL